MIKVDEVAPAWESVDQDGRTHASGDQQGSWYVLYFYPKDDTPGCTIEACGFRDHWLELQKKVRLFGVSADDVSSHKAFATKFTLPFPLLVDTQKNLIRAFGADGSTFPKRVTFLVDPDAVIRKIYKDFDCSNHADDLISDLSQLIPT